jgi:hypothetical protein
MWERRLSDDRLLLEFEISRRVQGEMAVRVGIYALWLARRARGQQGQEEPALLKGSVRADGDGTTSWEI